MCIAHVHIDFVNVLSTCKCGLLLDNHDNSIVMQYMYTIELELCVCVYALSSLSELTGSIPHIRQDDVTSGLSTKLLKLVVDKQDMNESLLKYVLFKLPLDTVKKPYDASGVDLVRILSKSTEFRVIDKLIELGMKLKPSQMEAVVLFVPHRSLDTFDMLLQYARKNNFSQSSLNVA